MKRTVALILGGLLAGNAGAYPLDGYDRTGSARLYAFDMVQRSLVAKDHLKPGSLWDMKRVKLRLLDQPGLILPKPDPAFSARVRDLLGGDASADGVGILDLSNPERPRYAEVNGSQAQQPASVRKMMVMATGRTSGPTSTGWSRPAPTRRRAW